MRNLEDDFDRTMYFSGNYWDNWKGFGKKIIFGHAFRTIYPGIIPPFMIPIFRFDDTPLREPVDISRYSHV